MYKLNNNMFWLIACVVAIFSCFGIKLDKLVRNAYLSSSGIKYNIKNNKNENIFKKNLKNYFFLSQNLYWHDNSTSTKITNYDARNVDFEMYSKYILTTNNSQRINSNNFINNLVQTTNYDVTNNSGSYQYGDNYYDSQKRIINWTQQVKDYLYINPNIEGKWGNLNDNPALDIKNIWENNTNHKSINAKAVFTNGNNNEYVFNCGKEFDFLRGCDHSFWNCDYHIYAIPYTYVKESQFIYVVYNFVSRFLYTLQTNNIANKYNFDIEKDNSIPIQNHFLQYFNITDLFSINGVDYDKHALKLGTNNEIINLVNEIYQLFNDEEFNEFYELNINNPIYVSLQDDITKGIINNQNWQKFNSLESIEEYQDKIKEILDDKNDLYHLFNKYQIPQSIDIYWIIETLKELLSLNIHYEIYNPDLYCFDKKILNISFNELCNLNKTIVLNKDNQGDYSFKITNIEVLQSKNENVFIPNSNNEFSLKNSCNHIETKNDYFIIKQQEIDKVIFNEMENKYLSNYPSYFDKELIERTNLIKLYDNQDQEIKIKNFMDNIELFPDDYNGKLTIKVKNKNRVFARKYENFKKFNINKYKIIDVSKYDPDLVASKCDKNKMDEIILNSGFDKEIYKLLQVKTKKIDDYNGKIDLEIVNQNDLNNQIEMKNFSKYYIKQKNDEKTLNNYKPSEITKNIFLNYLIEQSEKFKDEHDDLQIYLNADDNNCKLTAQIEYDDKKETYIYQFKQNINNKNLLNYICFGILSISSIILITIVIYSTIKTNKK